MLPTSSEAARRLDLVCPAGTLPALRAAVDHGADAVYLGFRGETNARNFPGLNFSADDARIGIDYAHAHDARVFVALNVYPSPSTWSSCIDIVDRSAALGADALILADPGLMEYAARHHPDLRLHLSVQSSATNWRAIEFYREAFNVRRAVLPRVLSCAQVARVAARTQVEIEAFGFGSLCVMVEGRCALSSYVTGQSPNTHGVCSPAQAVRWEETSEGRESRLNGVLIDRFAPGEAAGYPTLCKGRFKVEEHTYHAIEEPTSLNALDILPVLIDSGVKAIKVEGRQRSPAYVAQVTQLLRRAIDDCIRADRNWTAPTEITKGLDALAEGRTHTLGAYHRPWQ